LGGSFLNSSVADVTVTHIQFKSGIKAHVFVSWLHPFKEQKLVVVGDKKMIVFDDTKPNGEKLTMYPHKINWVEGEPVPTKEEGYVVPVDTMEPLMQECTMFLNYIGRKETPITDGHEALRVLRVLKASQESLDQGGIPVSYNDVPYTWKELGIHETAIVDDGVSIGDDTDIWCFSHILRGSRIGNNCSIGQNVVIGPDVIIGDNCKIQNNVSVFKGVTVEDHIFIGPSVTFTNVINPRSFIDRSSKFKPTLIKRGASIGANSTILCGVTIGENAFIGAGSVVTTNVPDKTLFFGNPARLRGTVDKDLSYWDREEV
jgi:UDP-2-acetamido-3-amino-2,3-dideoxy-glucuronate N-acetyltransferase